MAGRARRYATAIFELAQEEGGLDEWVARVESVRQVLTDPGLAALLDNPTVSPRRRLDALDAVGAGVLGGEPGLNLARLLVEARRASLIDEIAGELAHLVDASAGRVRALVTTAIELSAPEAERLQKDLSARLGQEVRLEVRVDPAIIGGLVLQVGDRVTDASVASRLRQLRRALATA